VSNKEGMFSKDRGHDSRENISVSFWMKYFSIVGGRTIQIRIVRTIPYILYSLYNCIDLARKSRHFGHSFRGGFQKFCGYF
jgi:hypothetical protein